MRAEREAGIKHLLNAHHLRRQRRPAPFVTLDLDLLQFIGLEPAANLTLDLAMPTITGFEGAKAFRKAANTRDAILVAFSGMITEDEQARFRRIGFDEVLPKPVAAIALVQRIEGFIARRRAAKSSEA